LWDGAANTFDLNPAINTISLVVGYSFNL